MTQHKSTQAEIHQFHYGKFKIGYRITNKILYHMMEIIGREKKQAWHRFAIQFLNYLPNTKKEENHLLEYLLVKMLCANLA